MAIKLGERRGNPEFIKDPTIRQNIAELAGTPTKTIAAERAGFGNPETLRQAKSVVATIASRAARKRGTIVPN